MKLSSFIRQKSYERVVYILHRHPITFLPKFFLFATLSLLPVLVYFLITNFLPNILSSSIGFTLSTLLGSIYYLSVLLLFYTEFVIYYLDVWIITSDRVIDVAQLNLFSRSVAELDLHNIQDVTSDIHGFFATLFQYGNVTIKTASNNSNIIFYNIHRPNKIREELIRLSDEDRKFHQLDGTKLAGIDSPPTL